MVTSPREVIRIPVGSFPQVGFDLSKIPGICFLAVWFSPVAKEISLPLSSLLGVEFRVNFTDH